MSGSGDSSGTIKVADSFEDLWRQLGECHHHVIGELESKVSRLKKDRCLDAQRLEVFYNRNQQLKEENKTLHDTINLLEERLRAGECDRCVVLEEKLKSSLDQNLRLLNELRIERNDLQDENGKLRAEIQKLKASCSSSDQDAGFIPDSPVLPSSLPPANKLRKRKQVDQQKHVRYEEKPIPHPHKSLLCEPAENAGKAEVLVPNTCELDTPQIADDEDDGEAIAETCAFLPVGKHPVKNQFPPNQQSSSKPLLKHNVCIKPQCFSSSTRIRSPDSTTKKSPSFLPHAKRFADDVSDCRLTKEEKREELMDDSGDKRQEGAALQVQPSDGGASGLKPPSSPAFRVPLSVTKGDGGAKKRTLNVSRGQPGAKECRTLSVEPAWSIDPALALSLCDGELDGDEVELEEKQHGGELMDTDCTWVSHSMLQRPGPISQDSRDIKPGLGAKAVDSLDVMFDTTAYGEYQSYSNLPLNHEEEDDDGDEEEEKHYEDNSEPGSPARPNKAQHPAFAHVAVVRKKDERRKLKGTTCKECEIYYAHLPEEEKQKKLSACSRHRYLYIPPCTPENFWEVGFPSTQTCIDRGYIKEQNSPPGRMKRRQPLNALFTPKKKEQSLKST
ncbi:DNA endonuclease RBBP8 [Oryzias melastigma]|uniref:DNA endonuclease RBBP8 n=1 Tax=Oryzias melastigma TaxID=30732 RepID=A0A3B3CCX5_ORYME|nr:DNA endonuclease RBBP8 [Oryzias melastigma]XP_024135869.1 DNA endonuclease RBBP8 [Oryzias melastigma]